ncbi:xaa-Pro aminopeptidase 2 [Drosophila biarmipes]|uniref:xaa-Pro aminopeptidase 2 n=1 Tax=Drosophila biarmipes TaxID=125945 RepID=UPI0007E695E8|nr:xaa-Pro aminopeptidase 2 [Drosophila biarmipes]XP_016961283.1 xaa-Pro aminopeptidase 2 [Drosophila biarmipes]XP_043951582.1 xaa-Pro aminopeptidase 2 [Drosophila biarmipes]
MTTAKWIWRLALSILLVVGLVSAEVPKGYHREICQYRKGKHIQPMSDHHNRLMAMRKEMKIRATLQGPEIDGYILPSTDEHLNQEVAARDQRLRYLSGFTGVRAFAAVAEMGAAMWVENRYVQQADGELECDWEIYLTSGNVTVADWLGSKIGFDKRVGADPHLVPHSLWIEWERQLDNKLLKLVKVNTNLVDHIWGSERPETPNNQVINVHEKRFAGEKWQDKVKELRRQLSHLGCDAMVVTSLTEVAYLLNIRGTDIPFTPVVKSYAIVSQDEIFFYVAHTKISLGIDLHLHTDCFNAYCVKIKEYNQIWSDIRTYAQLWKRVLVSAPCVQDPGASEAIYSSMPGKIVEWHISPIIFMRAQKNFVEQEGMRRAHIRDGAAICEALSNLETRFHTEHWTEEKIKYEVELWRLSQKHAKGLSLRTVVAYGEHSALPYYISSNVTNIEVSDQSLLVIESGGQYLEGTTDVSRTFIFGEPTQEMKKAYTNVLAGILHMAHLTIPSDLKPSKVDAVVRTKLWSDMTDYPQATGHGIGSFSSVEEPPISVAYGMNSSFLFKQGYFFSSESGYYKRDDFGVRLKNVLEVVDTGHMHPTGTRFLAFQDVTMVPYEPKLIDHTLLSAAEKRLLNEYNAKIRINVGDELKRLGNMRAFYWMMNKTRHIREYLPEDEYRSATGGSSGGHTMNPLVVLGLLILLSAFLES